MANPVASERVVGHDALILAAGQAGALSGQFTRLDWLVVIAYLVLTTLIGSLMAGKQATIRDFFLGGRKLPWYAVCGSNIATEISAVTFVCVPAVVCAPTGNFTYLQLGLIGSVLAKIIVGLVFVPAFYEREIYSPYDYMANQLGERARSVTTCLFILGGSLAQGSRVYLTALILDLIIGPSVFGGLQERTGVSTLVWSIYTIGALSVVWTWIGGITTVIWTDVILFLVFLIGAFVALAAAIGKLPGGLGEFWSVGWGAKEAGPWGKFTLFDYSLSPTKEFTIWTAAIASTWGGLGAFGTDQMMAQRIFCCKGQRDARMAVIASSSSQVIALIMLLVGAALYAFYLRYPLTGEAARLVAEKGDRIFPVFIIEQLPPGICGLVIAGIFAAAISTLVSVVASFSQTSLAAFYLPWRRRRLVAAGQDASLDSAMKDPGLVHLSRVLVLVWGLILCLMAQVADLASGQFPQILNLALAMAGYTGGAILAGFMLAFMRFNITARGYTWSAPLSVFVVFALVWHEPWANIVCWVGAAVLLMTWMWSQARERIPAAKASDELGATVVATPAQTVLLLAGIALMLIISHYGFFDAKTDPLTGKVRYATLAWPWFVPIGSSVAFLWGYLLARRKT